mgnify:CR=1 FL=1
MTSILGMVAGPQSAGNDPPILCMRASNCRSPDRPLKTCAPDGSRPDNVLSYSFVVRLRVRTIPASSHSTSGHEQKSGFELVHKPFSTLFVSKDDLSAKSAASWPSEVGSGAAAGTVGSDSAAGVGGTSGAGAGLGRTGTLGRSPLLGLGGGGRVSGGLGSAAAGSDIGACGSAGAGGAGSCGVGGVGSSAVV